MYDLITFGKITADLYFKADSLTTKGNRLYLAIGGKYFIEDFEMHVGGGGANVAIGVKKNRLRTAVCSLLGNNEFRKAILHKLNLKLVPKNFLVFKQKHDNISVILLKNDGSRTILNYESNQQSLTLGKKILKRLDKTRAVYFGNLPYLSLAERAKLMRNFKNKGMLIFTNLSAIDTKRKRKDLLPILEATDTLIMNRYEISEILKKNPKKLNLKKNILSNLIEMKGKILIITDAENGSYAYEDNKVYYQKAIIPKKIIDTTGAGDGYTAGFIAEYLKTQDIKLAMKKGAYYAAKIIGRIGAN